MDALKTLIESSIEQTFEQYKIAKRQYDEAKDYDDKQRALAKHFSMSREDLPQLRIREQKIGGVVLNNTGYCIKRFISEEAEIIEEGNYENEKYAGMKISYPLFRELEVSPGVFESIWSRATVFFRWKGEPLCISLRDDRIMEHTLFQVISKNETVLKEFIEVFRDYQKINHYLRGKKFTGLEGRLMPLSPYGWKDIILPEGMAERIHSEVSGVLRSSKTLTQYGLNSKKGFILAGDPGNGKTLLLKILANTVDAACIIVPFTKVQPEKDIAATFRLARYLAPTLLILEDVDLYGEDRDHAKDAEYLGELMNELDGMVDNKEIIVFATTNHLAKVEKALQNRPGRFDRIYKIPNPDLNGRRRLLEHFISKVPNQITKEDIEVLAENFSGYSGAYLKELVNSGFAQAVLRSEESPVLEFSDLASNLAVLKNDEKRAPMGFQTPRQVDQLEGIRAVRKENL